MMRRLIVALLCGVVLMGCRYDFQQTALANRMEKSIRSLTLEPRHYERAEVADVFGDIYRRANEKLDENGLYGISLCLADTNTDIDTSSVTIDVPEAPIFQAFEFVARRFGWTVEYNGGGVFVRGRHSEHLPGDAGGHETVE